MWGVLRRRALIKEGQGRPEPRHDGSMVVEMQRSGDRRHQSCRMVAMLDSIQSVIDALQFVRLALRAYRAAGANGLRYAAIECRGVPRLTLFIGTGRQAWKISNFATEAAVLR